MTADVDPLRLLADFGVTDVLDLEPVSGGWASSIWRVESPAGPFALRVLGPNRVRTCRLELLAMQAARDAGIPVPKVHATKMEPECSALLLAWVPGRPILPDALEHPDRVHQHGVQFGRMQARIHAVKTSPELEALGRSWIDWADPDAELRERLEAIDLRRHALLHLDYNVMNVMTDGSHITGVIDWTNTGTGDPRADLARSHAMMLLGASPPGMPEEELEAARRTLVRGWEQGYQEVAGPMGDLSLFYVWAGTVMLSDLPQHLGKPGVPLRQADLDRIAEWTRDQRGKAGLDRTAH